MATASGGADSDVSDFVCPVCFEPYKNPKSLSCGHSLCESCVQQLLISTNLGGRPSFHSVFSRRTFIADANGQIDDILDYPLRRIRCPQCRALTPVPSSGVPTNFQLAELLTRLNANEKQKITKRVCGLCENQLSEKEFWHCLTCLNEDPQNFFCSKCGLKSHNGHEMIELSEMMKRKWTTNDNVNAVKSETEDSVTQIKTRIAGIRDTLNNVIQVLDDHCSDRFNRVLTTLQSVDICGDEMLQETMGEAKRAQDDITIMCESVDTAQSRALAEIQSCFDCLSHTVEINRVNDEVETSGETLANAMLGADFDEQLEMEISGRRRNGVVTPPEMDNRPTSPCDSVVAFCGGVSQGEVVVPPRPVTQPEPVVRTPPRPHVPGLGGIGRGNWVEMQRGSRGRGRGFPGAAGRARLSDMETTPPRPGRTPTRRGNGASRLGFGARGPLARAVDEHEMTGTAFDDDVFGEF